MVERGVGRANAVACAVVLDAIHVLCICEFYARTVSICGENATAEAEASAVKEGGTGFSRHMCRVCCYTSLNYDVITHSRKGLRRPFTGAIAVNGLLCI